MKLKLYIIALTLNLFTHTIFSQQSGWFWQNPLPQGNSLYGLKMFDANNGICINWDNILKTTNGGTNWQIFYSGFNTYNSQIFFIDQNTGYIYLDSTILIKTINGGFSWSIVCQFNSFFIRQLCFINNNTGFLLNNGNVLNLYDLGTKLYRTTNGGSNWNIIFQDTSLIITSLFFPSPQLGFATGIKTIVPFNLYHTMIFRTSNYGLNWDSIPNNIIQPYPAEPQIYFINNNNGFISGKIGSGYGLLHTTNSGTNWTMLYTPVYDNINKIYFLDQNNGFILGDESLSRTTNSGSSWINYNISSRGFNYAIDFSIMDLNNVLVIGTRGLITKTTNGGANWVKESQGTDKLLYDVKFSNINTGFACGEYGILLKTTDGGNNWLFVINENSMGFVSIANVGNNVWFVSEWGSGKIFKTTNTGLSWDTLNTNMYGITRLKFINANTGFGVCKYNVFLKTTNGGINWASYNNLGSQNWAMDFVNENTGYVGASKLYKTTNAGLSWDTSTLYLMDYINDIQFINQYTGFVAGYDAGLYGFNFYKTTNGGQNWLGTNFNETQQLIDVFFINERIGFVTDGGNLYKTYNGCSNWIKSHTCSNNYMNTISFPDSNIGYMVGYYGSIIKTTTGGLPIGIQPISNSIPDKFILYQNYPNPFNPTTKIKFDLPPSPSERAGVRLVVFDLLGHEVTTLINESLQPGTYEVSWNGSNYASGVYFYQLRTSNFVQTKKLVLVK